MRSIKRIAAAALGATMAFTMAFGSALPAKAATSYEADQTVSFGNGVPWNVTELEARVNYSDPASVAACLVAACVRATDNFNDGDAMLKKLCATKVVYGNGYPAGSYDATTRSQFNERDRKWIPRSYFDGGTSANGYTPSRPWTIRLQYNAPVTEDLKKDSGVQAAGITPVVYGIKSNAVTGATRCNIVLFQYPGENRWWVNSFVGFMYQGIAPTGTGSNDDGTHDGGQEDPGEDPGNDPVIDPIDEPDNNKADRTVSFTNGYPRNVSDLAKIVDYTDPASVAANVVAATVRMCDSDEEGHAMLNELCATVLFGKPTLNDYDHVTRSLAREPNRKWIPRAFFNGGTTANGYTPSRPWTLTLPYNDFLTNQYMDAYKDNDYISDYVVYTLKSNAVTGDTRLNIELAKIDGRWWCVRFAGIMYQGIEPGVDGSNDDGAQQGGNNNGGNNTPANGSFNDVPTNSWYTNAVNWAVNNNVTAGSDGNFNPMSVCDRSQFVTMLKAAMKGQDVAYDGRFGDVSASAWYAKSVAWAAANNITAGSNGNFMPTVSCTRAQVVTFLYAAAGRPNDFAESPFPDVPANAWYANAVKWAYKNAIVSGIGGQFKGDDPVTRAQVVVMLQGAYGY